MTYNETLKVMSVLRAAYPGYYRDFTKQDAEEAASLWQTMFSSDTYEEVIYAVRAYIASDQKGFPPHIGAIRNEILRCGHKNEMTEIEAWELVRRAASNSSYGHEYDSFNALPETLKRIVGSPRTLHEWGQLNIGDFNTIIASQVMRAYRAILKEERRASAALASCGDACRLSSGEERAISD